MEHTNYDSGNINTLWLTNIYKNIENLERIEKRIITGYNEIIDILQIPLELREMEMANIKYYSMKEIISELITLITDIIPVITQTEFDDLNKKVTEMKKRINNKEIYLDISYNFVRNKINHVKLLPQFEKDFNTLIDIRRDIVRKIAHLLYISETKNTSKPW